MCKDNECITLPTHALELYILSNKQSRSPNKIVYQYVCMYVKYCLNKYV